MLLFTSCGQLLPAATPDLDLHTSLIPGECLNSTELHCPKAGPYEYLYEFWFKLDLNTVTEKLSRKQSQIHATSFRVVPSDTVFEQFGNNFSAVRKEYERVWAESIHKCETTIYKNGDITLLADKEFCGIPAGENLAGLIDKSSISPIPHLEDKMALPLPDGVIDSKAKSLFGAYDVDVFGLFIRYKGDGYERVNEAVNFSLSIPVRVVYYLTWLNDKLTDENAPMTWKDEVLTCTFSSNTGLRVKE